MTRNTLTQRQQEFFDWIEEHILRSGESPTMQQLSDHFVMKTSSAYDVVEALIKKGYLRKKGRGPYRTLELVDEFGQRIDPNSLPLIGEVAAGPPALAIDNRIGTVLVDDQMIQRGATFALRVKGDSMIEAGILEGDYVIVRAQSTADNGDIVLALVGLDDPIYEEATIKQFYRREDGRICLRPANSAMQDIVVKIYDCLIQGIVIGLQRVY